MPIALDDLQQLVRDYEEAARGEAERTGREKEALRRLKTDLDVDSLKAAVKLIRRLTRTTNRLADEYLAEYKRFKAALLAYRESLAEDET